jgi:hypothetical protein
LGIYKWVPDGRKITGLDWNDLVEVIEVFDSSPPEGAYKVTNIYVVMENGSPKLKVEYET